MFENEKEIACEVRRDVIEMIAKSKSGHPGGSLSMVDILVYLYFDQIKEHMDGSKDIFVLSKGHGAPALYSVLSKKGYIAKEELMTLRQFGSKMQGHPDANKVKGVDVSTGSLGQGISNAVGIALGYKMDNKNGRVFVILGDGELQEGLVWEAMMAASHYKLNNLVSFIDYNGLQIDGRNEEVMSLGDLKKKFESFGANTIVIDGHDFIEMEMAMKSIDMNRPNVIISKTIKGKGVSFMENVPSWHGAAPSENEKNKALSELIVCRGE